MRKSSPKGGFTLVELIIVIIILGILAALAIPQFTTSTDDAKTSTLKANLAVLRNALQLYYAQHNSVYPGATIVTQLTQYTNAAGTVSATKDPAFPFGPYLTKFPDNPLSVSGAAVAGVTVGTDAGTLTADAAPTNGWKYSSATGKIIANNATYETY